ncbi:MAG TPA: hypothetical protein VM433_08365 [Mycobacteriales bacterium]|nr:hypothetical protein [Mycobacteriales bacterium]
MTSRARRPPLLNRLTARVRDEVPAVQLEAFERAGTGVFELGLLVEQRRDELTARGVHLWEADAASASLFLCSWNARVHQALGSELLAADARQDPRTAGFVPPATYRQVWTFFAPVQEWVSRGRRAAVSDDFWIGHEVELPAALPDLTKPRSAPRKHLKGLLTAADAVDQLLDQALGAVRASGPPAAHWRANAQRIEELAAQARASLHYAQGLWHPQGTIELDAVIYGHLQPALVLEHALGQYLALPELVHGYRTDHAVTLRRRRGR